LTNLLILLPEIKIVIYTTYSELSILLDLEWNDGYEFMSLIY
jgi:hypothetical protein